MHEGNIYLKIHLELRLACAKSMQPQAFQQAMFSAIVWEKVSGSYCVQCYQYDLEKKLKPISLKTRSLS